MSLDADTIRARLEEAGSLLKGHFVLASGLHSDRYVQCAKLFEHPALAEPLSAELAERCRRLRPDVVLGPAYGGIILAYELARHLKCRAIFVERYDGEFKLRRGFEMTAGQRVLVAEDVITTGGSALEAMEVVKAHGAVVCGVASIIDRRASPGELTDLVSLLKVEAPAVPAADCRLCAEGTPAVAPGARKAARR